MNDWIETTIGEQATLQRGIDITKAEQRPGKVPVISSGGISSFHDTVAVKGPGVVLGRKGVVGSVFYLEEDYWPHDTSLWVKDFHGNNPRFVYYFFKSIARQITQMDVGSANPTLNRNHVHPIRIIWPSLPEQKAIAKILSSLDDKIELNRRMNATLEALARALFKAWFVDFEPVHANLEIRPSTSASPEIAKLFPSEFENGIPKGWEEKSLKEVFEVNPLRSLRKGVAAQYLEMSSVPNSGHRVSSVVDRAFTSGMKFKNGDTLLARITPCLENGKTAFVDFLKEEEIGWGSTEFIVLRPKNGFPEYFTYLLCRNDDFRNFAIQSMTGTSGRQRVQVDSLGKYPLLVPPSASLVGDKFGNLLNPFVAKIKQNSEEIDCLAQIRDSLLPRLISGKLRVDENERWSTIARTNE